MEYALDEEIRKAWRRRQLNLLCQCDNCQSEKRLANIQLHLLFRIRKAGKGRQRRR